MERGVDGLEFLEQSFHLCQRGVERNVHGEARGESSTMCERERRGGERGGGGKKRGGDGRRRGKKGEDDDTYSTRPKTPNENIRLGVKTR